MTIGVAAFIFINLRVLSLPLTPWNTLIKELKGEQ